MSDKQVTLYDYIDAARPKFELILQEDDTGVDWEKESVFAYQALTKNSFTMDIARKNPGSVRMAMINVASVGLSLNPATHYAYLVPRGGEICLDISYRGLIKIATDSGSIKWAKAELVYEGDQFTAMGPATPPEHLQSNPFSEDRGTAKGFLGVYCVAKTTDDDFLIEIMSATEIYKIRDEASPAGKKGPWTQYFGEMAKKCVLKRAQKTWPMSNRHERLQQAVSIINETEGSEIEPKHRWKPGVKEQIIESMRGYLVQGDAFGVLEICEEYKALEGTQPDTLEAQEQMKFWSLFSSVERDCIKRLLDDSAVERDRVVMGRADLNQPVETPEL